MTPLLDLVSHVLLVTLLAMLEFAKVSCLICLPFFLYKYLLSRLLLTMWEEYAVPGLMITFSLGVLLGINLGMLCIPRFFEPVCSSTSLPNNFIIKQPAPQPMRYPSGFTAKQLQQHDFTRRQASQQPPLGLGLGRRQTGTPQTFSY